MVVFEAMFPKLAELKTWVLPAAVGAGILLTGYLLGRYYAEGPGSTTKIIEKEKTETTILQKVDVQALVAEIFRRLDSVTQQKNVHREVITIKRPDGSSERREVVTDQTKTEKKSETTKDTKTDVKTTVNTVIAAKTEKEKVTEIVTVPTEKLPKWLINVGAGYHLPSLVDSEPGFNLLPRKDVVLTLGVDRRVLGPVYAGAWVDSGLNAGLRLTLGIGK